MEGVGVRLPDELYTVPEQVLDDFVQARCLQAVITFARRKGIMMTDQEAMQAAVAAYHDIPPVERGPLILEDRNLHLVFRHECKNIGCQRPDCPLCEHSSQRKCTSTFAPKGYVDAPLRAKCNAPIRIEIIDATTGIPLAEEVPDVHLEMCILDGAGYDAQCVELGGEAFVSDADLDRLFLPLTTKADPVPLLVPGEECIAHHNADLKVVVPLKRGAAELPDLKLASSSEAMLTGRKPTFRLLVRAVASDGEPVGIKHTISDGFVVTTRRTKADEKAEIPHWKDPVKKLEHVGKETVKKLSNLRASGVRAAVPDNCVTTVGQLHALLQIADGEPSLRSALQKALGLKKDQYEGVRAHAFKAVLPGVMLRTWFPAPEAELGLLFSAGDAKVDPFQPLAMLQRQPHEEARFAKRIVLRTLTRQHRQEVIRGMQLLKAQAHSAWWESGHPGWENCPQGIMEAFEPVNPGLMGIPVPLPVTTAKRHIDSAPHHSDTASHSPPSEEHPRKRSWRHLGAEARAESPLGQAAVARRPSSLQSPLHVPLQPASVGQGDGNLDLFQEAGPSFAAGLAPTGLLAQRSNSLPPENHFGLMPGDFGRHSQEMGTAGASVPFQNFEMPPPVGFPRRITSSGLAHKQLDSSSQAHVLPQRVTTSGLALRQLDSQGGTPSAAYAYRVRTGAMPVLEQRAVTYPGIIELEAHAPASSSGAVSGPPGTRHTYPAMVGTDGMYAPGNTSSGFTTLNTPFGGGPAAGWEPPRVLPGTPLDRVSPPSGTDASWATGFAFSSGANLPSGSSIPDIFSQGVPVQNAAQDPRPTRSPRGRNRSPRGQAAMSSATVLGPIPDAAAEEKARIPQQIADIANLRSQVSGSPPPFASPFMHPPPDSPPSGSPPKFGEGSQAMAASLSNSIPFPAGWQQASGPGQHPGVHNGEGMRQQIDELSQTLSWMKGIEDTDPLNAPIGSIPLDSLGPFPSQIMDLGSEDLIMQTSTDIRDHDPPRQ